MLRRCTRCDRYTLGQACPECDAEARDPAPPKFSPEDKYGAYRRRLKRIEEAKEARS